jgi:homoserine kinase type II
MDPLPTAHLAGAGRMLATLHNLPAEGGLDLPAGTRRLSSRQRGLVAGFPDRPFAEWLNARLDTITRHEAAHQRGDVPVHGDLFADNLIVGPDGDLSIIDWETASLDDPLLDLGMAAVGLCQDKNGNLATDRLHQLLQGYTTLRPLSEKDLAELPTEITHAAVIIAFHRYYRHHVRFPNPERAGYHLRMVDFAASVPDTL